MLRLLLLRWLLLLLTVCGHRSVCAYLSSSSIALLNAIHHRACICLGLMLLLLFINSVLLLLFMLMAILLGFNDMRHLAIISLRWTTTVILARC